MSWFLKLFHYTCRIIAKVAPNLSETNSKIILFIRHIDDILSLIRRPNLRLASTLVQRDLLEVKKIFFSSLCRGSNVLNTLKRKILLLSSFRIKQMMLQTIDEIIV